MTEGGEGGGGAVCETDGGEGDALEGLVEVVKGEGVGLCEGELVGKRAEVGEESGELEVRGEGLDDGKHWCGSG